MWGSAFADLAKKAQELQEQAKEQASHLHIASPSFFSLDVLQGETSSQPDDDGAALFATPQPSFRSSNHSDTTPQPTSITSSHEEAPSWSPTATNNKEQQPSMIIPMLRLSPATVVVKKEQLTQTATLQQQQKSSSPPSAVKMSETKMLSNVNKESNVIITEDTVAGEASASFVLEVPQDVSPSEEVEGNGWQDSAFDVADEVEEEEEEESLVFTGTKMPQDNCTNHPEPSEATKSSAVENAVLDMTCKVVPFMIAETHSPLAAKETGWDEDDAFDVEGEEESFKTTLDEEVVNPDVRRESDLAEQPVPVDFPGEVDKEPADFLGQVEKEPSPDQVVSEDVSDEANVAFEALDERNTTASPGYESHVETGVHKTDEYIVSDHDEHSLVASSNDRGVSLEPKEDTPESHVEPCVDEAHESTGSDNDEHATAFTSSSDHGVGTPESESHWETFVDKAHESIGSDNDGHVPVASHNDFEMTPEPKEDMGNTHMANGDDFVDECHQPAGATDDFYTSVDESNETADDEEEVILPQVSLTKDDDSNDEAIDGTAKSQIKSPDEAVVESDDLNDQFVEDDAEAVDHVAPDASVGSMTAAFKDEVIEEHIVKKAEYVAPGASAVSVTDYDKNEAYTEKAEVADEAPVAPNSTSQSSQAVQREEFALELKRLKDAHQAEISSLEQRHVNQLQEALASFNHDQCRAERQEMEQRFMGVIRGHEGQLQELMSENEGYQRKIGLLKEEVAGKQALFEQRDSTMDNVVASHNKNVGILEQKVKDMEEAASLAKSDANKAKEELQTTKHELVVSNEAYGTLKARVKVVATELKERRVECRTLGAKVTELNETNEQLETQITNLQSKLSDRDRNHTENDRQTKLLKERIEKLEIDLNKTEHALKERDAIGEKALSAYKKKAQSALAVANARAAAANQAKEEAEIEAATARTLSEDAIHRARVAEAAGNEALAEAKAYVRDMENETGVLEKRALEATAALKKATSEAQHLNNSLEVSRAAQEKLVQDVRLISHEREQERAHRRELEHQLADSQYSLDLLYDEVGKLREELRQAAAAAAANSHVETDKDLWSHPGRTRSDSADRSDAEGTIAMLESELRDANRAIKELKDALRTAIAEQGSNGHGHNLEASGSAANHQSAAASSEPAGNESMPLFFAMEKQAELSTAHNEINRLANLLGDAEFSKMEALEAMEDMKCQMDQAEARLKRFEKFGAGTNNPGSAAPAAAAPGLDANGNVNLEYLKNIMLSYLNAKSVAEKKALVPVISAVLCLTPQEQAAVFKNMEQSSGLEGVGMALFDTFR